MKHSILLAVVIAGSFLLAACTDDAGAMGRCRARGPAVSTGAGGPAGNGVPANVAGSGC